MTRVQFWVLLNAGMPEIESRNTKTRNNQNKLTYRRMFDVRRNHKHPFSTQLLRQKQFSLVFVYFYSQFYSLPNNFLFRPLLRFSITSRDHNLEMIHRQYFVLPEVSDCTVVLLIEVLLLFTEGHQSVTPPFPLSDFLLSINVFLVVFLI